MKVEKNSPLAQMLLKLAAERDPKLRDAIRNGEVEGVNIIALGAPDDKIKELLDFLADGEDDCENCENRDGREEAKTATPYKNPVPRMVSPKRMNPYTARRAAMLADVSAAICHAQTDILDAMHRYPEFAEITDAYFDDSDEENTTETE